MKEAEEKVPQTHKASHPRTCSSASPPPPPTRCPTPPQPRPPCPPASHNPFISSRLCGRFMAQTPEGFSFLPSYFSPSSPRIKPARHHFITGVSRHSRVNEPRAHTGNIDSWLSLMGEQENVRSQHRCTKTQPHYSRLPPPRFSLTHHHPPLLSKHLAVN